MRVQLLPWDGLVEGLGAGLEMPLGQTTLGEHTRLALEGCELVDEGPRLVVHQGSVLGPSALEAAWAAVQGCSTDLVLRLDGRSGVLLDAIELGQGPALGFLRGPGEPGDRLSGAAELRVPSEERVLALPIPGGPLALSDRFVVRVRHPLQLLWANLLSLPPVLWRELAGEGLVGLLRVAWAVLRAGSTAQERVAATMTVQRGASVHPSAVVEASLLLPGAVVEAGAVVRGSVLGPGARVEALAVCEGSVLGEGAVVQRQALSRYCVLGPGAMLGGTTQLSVFGPGSSLKAGSFAMDQGLSGEVRVSVDGALQAAPLGLAGCSLGKDTLVGSGVWIAPGRQIPPGITVLGPQALTHPGLVADAAVYSVVDGKLEPR